MTFRTVDSSLPWNVLFFWFWKFYKLLFFFIPPWVLAHCLISLYLAFKCQCFSRSSPRRSSHTTLLLFPRALVPMISITNYETSKYTCLVQLSVLNCRSIWPGAYYMCVTDPCGSTCSKDVLVFFYLPCPPFQTPVFIISGNDTTVPQLPRLETFPRTTFCIKFINKASRFYFLTISHINRSQVPWGQTWNLFCSQQ